MRWPGVLEVLKIEALHRIYPSQRRVLFEQAFQAWLATRRKCDNRTMLRTNSSILAKEAANFDRIAGELKSVITRVESISAEMDTNWKGAAAQAAKRALQRFHEAAMAQNQELNDIATKLQSAGTLYHTTDDEGSSALQAAMNLGG